MLSDKWILRFTINWVKAFRSAKRDVFMVKEEVMKTSKPGNVYADYAVVFRVVPENLLNFGEEH